MAEIFLAHSISGAGVERIVVLKRVLRHAAQDPELVQLFVDEARLAAQLQHPNVVQVYDVGKLGSSYFFAMEYVHGETVRDLLLHARHHGVRLPIATVLTIAAGAAAGLQHAHDRRGLNGRPLQIVHCDVSPSNLMITREGVVKVVDFGIAKAEHRSVNIERSAQGKLCYMSPEQVRSQPLDRRSDLFSLGIVVWELLTLQGCFRAESDFNVMDAIINQPSRAPSQLRSDVPREVDEIVMRMLAKNPANRYQTAADVIDAIEVAAMRMSTLLSTASVARQMREWFGDRSEPWFEQTVGGSIKRVVVDAEPVPADFASMTLSGPIDDILDTMPPSFTKPPASEGAMAWDHPTIESNEAMRDRLFREVRERKTPQPTATPPPAIIVESRKAIHDATPPAARPVQAPVTAPITAPVRPSGIRPPEAGAVGQFPRFQEAEKSRIPMVLLAILITVGIGAASFALLWKTMMTDSPKQRDAGVVEPADGSAAATTPSK